MPFYDSEAIERARQVDLLTYLQTLRTPGAGPCVPATSTAPGNMTACAFPMGNGAGFRRDSEGTARWTTSSSQGLFFYGGHGNHLRKGCHPAAVLCASAEGEKPKHLLLPQAAPDNRAMMAYLKGRGIDQEILDYCVQTGRIMRAGTRVTATWFLWASTRTARRGSVACGESVKPGSTGI